MAFIGTLERRVELLEKHGRGDLLEDAANAVFSYYTVENYSGTGNRVDESLDLSSVIVSGHLNSRLDTYEALVIGDHDTPSGSGWTEVTE